MYNFAFGRQPPTFDKMFQPLGVNNRTGNYQLLNYKTNFFDKFPSVFLPKVWNDNSTLCRHCLTLSSLKSLLSDVMLDRYNKIEHCEYDQCPDCKN